MSGASGGKGKGSPYPSAINITGVVGTITSVTAQLNGLTHPYPADLDFLLVGPNGQTVMLMSDAGGSHSVSNINLTFSDNAGSNLTSSQIGSGTFKPTNLTGDSDAFPSPAPAQPYGSTLSAFNTTTPNGSWNLFVLDEYFSGSGSLGSGWALTIAAQPSPPLVTSLAATVVTSSTAIIRGTINPLGLPGSYSFKLGTSSSYSDSQPTQDAGSSTASNTVTLTLAGLKPATTYHYRLSGQNSEGDSAGGSDLTFTTLTAMDSDGDGMPDDYENNNGLNPGDATDAVGDLDGDGLTNGKEYTAGTNPRDSLSRLRISATDRSGDDVSVSFTSVFGKRYRLEVTDDPASGAWTTLTDNIAGTGATVTVTDFAVLDSLRKRTYRVVVLP